MRFIVRGETWQHRERLRRMGFFWSPERRGWVMSVSSSERYFVERIRRQLAELAGVVVKQERVG